jgi:hypothetical protein
MPRALRLLSNLCLAAAGLVLAAWAVGRLASDRWLWSQYLAWVPEEWTLAVAFLLWAPGWGLRRLARSRQRSRAAVVVGLGCLAVGLHLTIFEWRLFNALTRRPPAGPSLRLLHWNATAVERTAQITGPVLAQRPDVAVLVNPHSRVAWHEVIAAFGRPVGLIWENGFVILSRVHIIRHGSLWLGLQPQQQGRWTDPGRALFMELDTTATLGRTTIIWVVDLPSDFKLSRWALAGSAAAAIAAWPGPELVHDAAGGVTPRDTPPGFPPPDVVVGDFNIPRGSASLGLLAPGMENAFDQAGCGYAATWPRHGSRLGIPIWHLDQMFVGRGGGGGGVRAARYNIIDPGFGYHHMQTADLVAR